MCALYGHVISPIQPWLHPSHNAATKFTISVLCWPCCSECVSVNSYPDAENLTGVLASKPLRHILLWSIFSVSQRSLLWLYTCVVILDRMTRQCQLLNQLPRCQQQAQHGTAWLQTCRLSSHAGHAESLKPSQSLRRNKQRLKMKQQIAISSDWCKPNACHHPPYSYVRAA